jgi:hypothetical protein
LRYSGRANHRDPVTAPHLLAGKAGSVPYPYPAAVDDALAAYEALLRDGTAPSDIAFAGESARVTA